MIFISQGSGLQIPRGRMSVNMARDNCRVWIDGSFYSGENAKSGSAAVVMAPKDKEERVAFIQAFNLTRLNLQKSTNAELWGATLALEQMKNFNVTELITDCGYVRDKVERIMNNTLENEYYEDELFTRLRDAIANQDDLHISQVKRSQQKIPLADKFAKAAAKENFNKISKHLAKTDTPCLFHTVSETGRIKRTTLIEHINHASIDDLDDFLDSDMFEGDDNFAPHHNDTLDPV